MRAFDVNDPHPNGRIILRSARKAYDLKIKDGDVIPNGCKSLGKLIPEGKEQQQWDSTISKKLKDLIEEIEKYHRRELIRYFSNVMNSSRKI
jgi:hypothetical protein